MNAAKAKDTNGNGIDMDGNIVPTDRWKFFCFATGKLLTLGFSGLAVLVLCLVLYGVYMLSDRHLSGQNMILQQLSANQANLVKAVEQKNQTIIQNHELLLASQARDDATLQALKENGMIQQAVLSTLEQANKSMAPVPELRQRALLLQEQQLALQQTQSRMLEILATKLEKPQ